MEKAESMHRRLYNIRTALGLKQREFGVLVGYSGDAYGVIERNEDRTISNQLVKCVCAVFDVRENYLKYGEGEMFKDTKELNRLSKPFYQLPPNIRRRITTFIEELAQDYA